MKIAVLGTGYVGLSTGVCLSEIGQEVTCIDVDDEKIKQLHQGIPTIYEPGLEPLLEKNFANGNLKFTTSHQEGLKDKEIIVIAVGTPQSEDGAADLSYLVQAAKDIGTHLDHDAIVVIKSTVPVGTNEKILRILQENIRDDVRVKLASNPEFLRQGSAINDTMRADRLVIGSNEEAVAKKVEEMYCNLNIPILHTSIESAEMIKYASNAFLATKISFINEIANLSEAVGANVVDVATGMGKDKRIGEAFLNAGIGYGGSCFPKDVKALVHTANTYGVDFGMLKETMAINDHQRERLVWKALNRFGDLKGRKIALLGLSFKPETDDIREAPSIIIARSLIKHGAEVVAYDPVATENAKRILGEDNIEYNRSVDEAVADTDAVFIVTEWDVIRKFDVERLLPKMKHPIIFDGRNCLDEETIRNCKKVEYYPIGKPDIIR